MSQTFVTQQEDGMPIIWECIPWPRFPPDDPIIVIQTPMDSQEKTTKSSLAIKKLDNGTFARNLIESAMKKPTQVQFKANGQSRTFSLAPAVGQKALHMKLGDHAIWVSTETDEESYAAIDGGLTIAILLIVAAVAGVAVYSMSNNEGSCNVAVETNEGGHDEGK